MAFSSLKCPVTLHFNFRHSNGTIFHYLLRLLQVTTLSLQLGSFIKSDLFWNWYAVTQWSTSLPFSNSLDICLRHPSNLRQSSNLRPNKTIFSLYQKLHEQLTTQKNFRIKWYLKQAFVCCLTAWVAPVANKLSAD